MGDDDRSDAQTVCVRLFMPLSDAEILDARLASMPRTAAVQRVLDQLWLRSVLIEQWRRTGLRERDAFVVRANRVLAALDA
jgi:hypothetical protein